MTRPGSGVPDNARENLDVLRRFEDAADDEASTAQLLIERASRFFGSPAYFLAVIVFAATWIGVDTLGRARGWAHMEPPPYFWLQGMVSLNALLLTVAVLIRQRRMSELAEHRAHLDLQVNLLTEQKVAKILEILSAGQASHAADESGDVAVKEELTRPADPAALLAAIKQSAQD